MVAQTQYEQESAKATGDNNEKETIAITIPIGDRNPLRERLLSSKVVTSWQ